MALLRASEVEQQLGFSRNTLLRWEDEGKISGAVVRTPGGQRRYDSDKLSSLLTETEQSKQLQSRPQYAEFGTTGVNKWRQSSYAEQLEPLKGRKGRALLREMRLNDPVIAATFFGLNSAIRHASKRIVPASDKNQDDKRAASFLESCFEDMSWAWVDQFSFVYESAFEQGFSVLEPVYKKRLGDDPPKYVNDPAPSLFDDGLIGWRKWSPRPAQSLLDGDEWIMDDNGGIRGINQAPEQSPLTGNNSFDKFLSMMLQADKSGIIKIPIERLLHFRTTVYPANTPEGLAIHRPAYVPWWMSMNIAEIEGIGVERDLAGIPVLYLGKGTSLSVNDANSDFSTGMDLVTNIRKDEQHGVVIPHPKMTNDGEGAVLELLATNTRRQYDITEIINRYDRRKAMVTLAQFIMLGMEGVGSYALSKHQGDLFVLAVEGYLNGFANIINRHAVPKLIRLNKVAFPNITGMPQLKFGPVGVPDLEALGNYINFLVDKQVITPDQELEQHMRQVAGLPPMKINLQDTVSDILEQLGGDEEFINPEEDQEQESENALEENEEEQEVETE